MPDRTTTGAHDFLLLSDGGWGMDDNLPVLATREKDTDRKKKKEQCNEWWRPVYRHGTTTVQAHAWMNVNNRISTQKNIRQSVISKIHSIKTDIACFFVTCEDRSQTPLKNHTILCVVELGEPLQTQENAVYDKFFITRAFLSIWQKLYIKFFLYLCYTHCVCPSDKLGSRPLVTGSLRTEVNPSSEKAPIVWVHFFYKSVFFSTFVGNIFILFLFISTTSLP